MSIFIKALKKILYVRGGNMSINDSSFLVLAMRGSFQEEGHIISALHGLSG